MNFIKFSIFSKVDEESLVIIGQVNKHFRALSRDDRLWKSILADNFPVILEKLEIPEDRFKPFSEYNPSHPEEYGASPQGLKATYLFVKKLTQL